MPKTSKVKKKVTKAKTKTVTKAKTKTISKPKANLVTISPLEMIVKNRNNQTRRSIAINEVSVLRQSRQAASLSIKQGSRQIIKKLVSDGVLVSTPAGSTAYNLSVQVVHWNQRTL